MHVSKEKFYKINKKNAGHGINIKKMDSAAIVESNENACMR